MPTARIQLEQIKRLCSNYPIPNWGTPDERLRAFVLASKLHTDEAIEETVTRFITGKVKRNAQGYLPTAAEFGEEMNQVANRQYEHKRLTNYGKQRALPEPEKPPLTDRQRQQVRELMEEAKATLLAADPIPDKTGARPVADISKAVAERFKPSQDPHEMKERLYRNG